MATSQTGMSFACGMCGKGYKTAAECVDHIQTHTSHRPFRCLVCWPMFTDVADSQPNDDVTQPAMGIQPAGPADAASVDTQADRHDAEAPKSAQGAMVADESPVVLSLRADTSHAGVAGSVEFGIVPAGQQSMQQEKLTQQIEPESSAKAEADSLQGAGMQSAEGEKEPSTGCTKLPENEATHADCMDSEPVHDGVTVMPTSGTQPDCAADTATETQTCCPLGSVAKQTDNDSGSKAISQGEAPCSRRKKRGARRRASSRSARRKKPGRSISKDNSTTARSVPDGQRLADSQDLKQQAGDVDMHEESARGDLSQHADVEYMVEEKDGVDSEQAGGGGETTGLQGQMDGVDTHADDYLNPLSPTEPATLSRGRFCGAKRVNMDKKTRETVSESQKQTTHSAEGGDGTCAQQVKQQVTPSHHGDSVLPLVPPADDEMNRPTKQISSKLCQGQTTRTATGTAPPGDSDDDNDTVQFDRSVNHLQSSLPAEVGDAGGSEGPAADSGSVDENSSDENKQVIQVETKSKGPTFTNVIQFLKSVSLGATSPSPTMTSILPPDFSSAGPGDVASTNTDTDTGNEKARSGTGEDNPKRVIHIVQRQGDSRTSNTVQSGDKLVVKKAQEPMVMTKKPLRTYGRSQKNSPISSTGQQTQPASGSPARAATIKIIASPSQGGMGKQTATVRIIASPSKGGQFAATGSPAEPKKGPMVEYLCVPAFTMSPQQDKPIYHPINPVLLTPPTAQLHGGQCEQNMVKDTEWSTSVLSDGSRKDNAAGSQDKTAADYKDSNAANAALLSSESASVNTLDYKVPVSSPSGVTRTITLGIDSASWSSRAHADNMYLNQSSILGHSEVSESQKITEGQAGTIAQAGGGIAWELERVREVGDHPQGGAAQEPSLSLEDLANVCAWIQRVNTEQGAQGWQTEIVGQIASDTGPGQSDGVLWTVDAVPTQGTGVASTTQDLLAVKENLPSQELDTETENTVAPLDTTTSRTDTPVSRTEISDFPASQVNISVSVPVHPESQDLQMSASPRHSRQASSQSEGDSEKELMLSCVDLYHKRKVPKQGTAPATPAARTRSQVKMGQAGVASGAGKVNPLQRTPSSAQLRGGRSMLKRGKQHGGKRRRLQSPDQGQTSHSVDSGEIARVSSVDSMPEVAHDGGGAGLQVATSGNTSVVSQSPESRVDSGTPRADFNADAPVMPSVSVTLTNSNTLLLTPPSGWCEQKRVNQDGSSAELTLLDSQHPPYEGSESRNVLNNGAGSSLPSAVRSLHDGPSALTTVCNPESCVDPLTPAPSSPNILTGKRGTGPNKGSEPAETQVLTGEPVASVTCRPRRGKPWATDSPAEGRNGTLTVEIPDSSPVRSLTGLSPSPTSGKAEEIVSRSTRSRDRGTTPKQNVNPDTPMPPSVQLHGARKEHKRVSKGATLSPTRRHDLVAVEGQAVVEKSAGAGTQSPNRAKDLANDVGTRRETRNTPKHGQSTSASVQSSPQDSSKEINPLLLTAPSAQLRGGCCEQERDTMPEAPTARSSVRQESPAPRTDAAPSNATRGDTENGVTADSKEGSALDAYDDSVDDHADDGSVDDHADDGSVDGHADDSTVTEGHSVPSTRSKALAPSAKPQSTALGYGVVNTQGSLTPNRRQQAKTPSSCTIPGQTSDTGDKALGQDSTSPAHHTHRHTASSPLDKRRLSGVRARQVLRVAKSVRARGKRYSQISSPVKRRRTEGSGPEALPESVYMAKGRLRASTLFSHPQYYGKRSSELGISASDTDRDSEPTSDVDNPFSPRGPCGPRPTGTSGTKRVNGSPSASGAAPQVQSSRPTAVVTKAEVQTPAGRDQSKPVMLTPLSGQLRGGWGEHMRAKHTSVGQDSTADLHGESEMSVDETKLLDHGSPDGDNPNALTVRLPFMSRSSDGAGAPDKCTSSSRGVTRSRRVKRLRHSFPSATVSSENRPSSLSGSHRPLRSRVADSVALKGLRQKSGAKSDRQKSSSAVDSNRACDVRPNLAGKAGEGATAGVLSEISQANEVSVDRTEGPKSQGKQAALQELTPENSLMKGDEGQPYQCDKCGAKFSHRLTLLSHKAVHDDSLSDYTCDICFRTFTRPYSVKVHRMIHTKEALVDCEICGRTLANAGNLAVHMRIHRDEKPFACKMCPKRFRQQSCLRSHMRTHSKERPFRCEYCGKSYAFMKNLYTHRFSHTGERPYQCTFCDSAFRQISALKVHLRAHTGEKPFKCDVCLQRFTQKSHLKKHLRHMHSPKVTPQERREMERLRPHHCELCGKGFCSSFSAKRHVNGGYCPEDPRFVPIISKNNKRKIFD